MMGKHKCWQRDRKKKFSAVHYKETVKNIQKFCNIYWTKSYKVSFKVSWQPMTTMETRIAPGAQLIDYIMHLGDHDKTIFKLQN